MTLKELLVEQNRTYNAWWNSSEERDGPLGEAYERVRMEYREALDSAVLAAYPIRARLLHAYDWVLSRLCSLTGHAGACWVMNGLLGQWGNRQLDALEDRVINAEG